jgi:3-oxoacyl-[acyl-carrier protein] reductase
MLSNQVALVTGTRGIGGACARLLAERRSKVVVVYKQNQNAAERLMSSIVTQGGEAEALQADVLDQAQIRNVIAHIRQRYGRLDILVSNAAVGWLEKSLEQLSWEEFSREVNSELKAAFDLTQAVLPMMCEQRFGRLIYMASNLMSHTLPNTIASSTAKAALAAFMRNVASEYGPLGITANAVAPAMVSTEHNQYLPHSTLEAIEHYTPLRRIATPEDVAGVVAFLASPDSAFMTGACLVVDGGKTLAA